MKKIVLVGCIVIGSMGFSIAQNNDMLTKVESAAAALSSAEVGDVMAQLGENISPKAFEKTWKTTSASWLDKTKNAADVSALSGSLLTLADNLKEKSFTPAWEKNKVKWIKQVKEARSPLAISGLLKTLSSNINATAFNKDWPSKSAAWSQSLAKLLE